MGQTKIYKLTDIPYVHYPKYLECNQNKYVMCSIPHDKFLPATKRFFTSPFLDMLLCQGFSNVALL